jgi:hypothetical protein
MAEHLYGDPDKGFMLTLHRRRTGEGGVCVAELEVSPAPVKGGLTLTLDINGHTRAFALEVPPSVLLDPEADPPGSAFPRAAEPVPEEAFRLQGDAEWRGHAWPPHLVLRHRRGPAATWRCSFG